MKHFDTDSGTESALNARELLIIAPFYGTGNAYPDCAAGRVTAELRPFVPQRIQGSFPSPVHVPTPPARDP